MRGEGGSNARWGCELLSVFAGFLVGGTPPLTDWLNIFSFVALSLLGAGKILQTNGLWVKSCKQRT
jgi:hypothetical protein